MKSNSWLPVNSADLIFCAIIRFGNIISTVYIDETYSLFAVRIVHLPYETSFAASTKALLIADLDAPVSIRALALSGILLFCG